MQKDGKLCDKSNFMLYVIAPTWDSVTTQCSGYAKFTGKK